MIHREGSEDEKSFEGERESTVSRMKNVNFFSQILFQSQNPILSSVKKVSMSVKYLRGSFFKIKSQIMKEERIWDWRRIDSDCHSDCE